MNPNIHRFLWSRLVKTLILPLADNEARPQGAVSPDISSNGRGPGIRRTIRGLDEYYPPKLFTYRVFM